MDLIKAFIRQYWLNSLAFGVLVAALVRYIRLARWEANALVFAFAAFGFLCVIASEEVAEWSGRYGWTRKQWRDYPVDFISFSGGVTLVVATVVLYLR